ncbi:hypothetical protein ABFS83_10G158100 [Erythranthe nasuta]
MMATGRRRSVSGGGGSGGRTTGSNKSDAVKRAIKTSHLLLKYLNIRFVVLFNRGGGGGGGLRLICRLYSVVLFTPNDSLSSIVLYIFFFNHYTETCFTIYMNIYICMYILYV